jgi:Ca2+-binding EF-hand superfamily protein
MIARGPLLAALLCLSSSALASDPLAAQDLLVLAPARPLILRLVILVDGQPFRQLRDDRFAQLWAEADPQGTGALSAEAARRVAAGLGVDAALPGPAAEALDTLSQLIAARGGRIRRDELVAQLDRLWPPLSIELSTRSDPRAGPALFPLLDADRDGRLAAGELTAAPSRLALRDFDDNLLISRSELVLDLAPVSLDAERGPSHRAPVVLPIDSRAATDALVPPLLQQYDRNGDGRLQLGAGGEVDWPPLATLDADRDGRLSAGELAGLASRIPDVEWTVELGRSRGVGRRLPDLPDGLRARRKLDGGYQLQADDVALTLQRNNRDPAQAADTPSLAAYDADGNGYLDADEARGVPGLLNLAAADTDTDAKLFPAELQEYFRRQQRAASLRLVLSVLDLGQDLFSLADDDHDGQLTPREQQGLLQTLAAVDTDGDGLLGAGEIPRQIVLELARGGTAVAAAPTRARGAPAARRRESAGPLWFQKMDRNGDGDLSPSEFLGPAEQFAQLDADEDALVDAAEAARARP